MAKKVTNSKEIAKDTLNFTTKAASKDIGPIMGDLRKVAWVFLMRLEGILAKADITNINYHQNSFIDEISSNLMDNSDISSSLRGEIYLALLDFERVIYEIMNWKLIFTFVQKDGTVLFAGQEYLEKFLYQNVGVGGKGRRKIKDLKKQSNIFLLNEEFLSKEKNEKTFINLKRRNKNTKQYFEATLNRFENTKKLVAKARKYLSANDRISNSYLYYKDQDNDKKYHFYNNKGDPYYEIESTNVSDDVPQQMYIGTTTETEIAKIIYHIERLYIINNEKNQEGQEKYFPTKEKQEDFPKKINRGHISEGYVRFLANGEKIPQPIPGEEQRIKKIMSYIRNDSVSQLFGGDVQIMQENQEGAHLQLSVKSFAFSLASYKPFIALAQVIMQDTDEKITLSKIKDFLERGQNGEITLTGKVGQMLVENIRKNLLPQAQETRI